MSCLRSSGGSSRSPSHHHIPVPAATGPTARHPWILPHRLHRRTSIHLLPSMLFRRLHEVLCHRSRVDLCRSTAPKNPPPLLHHSSPLRPVSKCSKVYPSQRRRHNKVTRISDLSSGWRTYWGSPAPQIHRSSKPLSSSSRKISSLRRVCCVDTPPFIYSSINSDTCFDSDDPVHPTIERHPCWRLHHSRRFTRSFLQWS